MSWHQFVFSVVGNMEWHLRQRAMLDDPTSLDFEKSELEVKELSSQQKTKELVKHCIASILLSVCKHSIEREMATQQSGCKP